MRVDGEGPQHPGRFLREELDRHEMTQTQFAAATGWTLKHVNRVIVGRVRMTPLFALAVEETLGTSAETLVTMQALHDLGQLREG